MKRLSRCFVGAAFRKPRVRAFHALAKNWGARGVRERPVCEPLRWRSIDSTASLCSVARALRNEAVEA
eukprot:11176714-Lingulodinium_polyedra.AAC.1